MRTTVSLPECIFGAAAVNVTLSMTLAITQYFTLAAPYHLEHLETIPGSRSEALASYTHSLAHGHRRSFALLSL
ncbi:hypothetical protein FPV67DRAFT_1481611 [Lyophyllum atratum]|nr:hypothetical protein FPV67DRAFT_1481611 [Lyophyllum atratum]